MARTITLVSKDGKASVDVPEDDKATLTHYKRGLGFTEKQAGKSTKKAGE